MKQVIIILFFGLLALSGCSKNENELPVDPILAAEKSCGSSLLWLKEIIKKAEEDKATRKYRGDYIGAIHLATYNNANVFLVDMFMCGAVSGVMYCAFDCSGTKMIVYSGIRAEQQLFSKLVAEGKLLYKNTP